MTSTIEVYIPRFFHVIYVEEYSHTYAPQGSPVQFTTDRTKAKVFEREEAVRVSNVVYDHFRANARRYGLPKNANISKEISVYVNEKKKKESFPTWIVVILILILFVGFIKQ